MPSIFTRKKSSTPGTPTTTTTAATAATPTTAHTPTSPPPTPRHRSNLSESRTRDINDLPRRDSSSFHEQSQQQRALQSSPEKKSRSSFVRERESTKEKDKRPKSPRNSKSYGKPGRKTSDSHPLNLPPEELRRLSALSAASMGSSQNGENGEAMQESTPAPQTPGAFPGQTNGETESNGNESQPSQNGSSPEPPVDAEKCKEAGNKFFKAKQYDQAIEEYTKAIDADPQAATYLSNRAAAFMAANQFVLALDDCKQADEMDPNNPKILHRMARIYTSLGRPQEALDIYDRIDPPATAKDKSPATQMKTHIAQAEDTLRNGTTGSMALHAIDQAERGLGYGVLPPRKWKLMRGEAYLKMGNVNSLGDAQNVAMGLLRSNNADPDALVLRGRALYAQGENDKAIQHFRQALACDPDFKEAVKYLRMVQKLDRMKEEGNQHFKLGRYQQAVDVYSNALSVDPGNKGTNSKILNNRAMCYSKLKNWDDAVKDCDQAIKLDPSYTKARKTRAKALGEGGDWEEAVRAYKNIAETSPEEPGIAKEVRNAEMELKKSKRKDYYKILGVDKDAGETEIKRAYRKLAVVHHPDKNPGDPKAEERFKDIAESYETLTDPQKRQRYDSGVDLMEPGEGMGGGFPGGMGGMGGMGGGVQIDPEMLFNMMNGGGRGGGGGFSFGGMGGGQQQRGGFPGGFSF